MKTHLLTSTAFAAALLLPPAATLHAAALIDFEGLSYASDTPTFENGAHLSGGPFVSRGATFTNDYTAQFDSFTDFAYSRATNTTTGDFSNQYSAFPGGGSGLLGNVVPGGSYGVAYVDVYNPDLLQLPTITLPAGETIPLSLRVTNTTYAALTIRDGGGFGAVKFGGPDGTTPDFFKLTITGVDSANAILGSLDYYLADFRAADNALDYIVDDWEQVSLASLGTGVAKLRFNLVSSQPDGFGGYTSPLYFAVDNVQTVPEPGAISLLLGGFLSLGLRRRRS